MNLPQLVLNKIYNYCDLPQALVMSRVCKKYYRVFKLSLAAILYNNNFIDVESVFKHGTAQMVIKLLQNKCFDKMMVIRMAGSMEYFTPDENRQILSIAEPDLLNYDDPEIRVITDHAEHWGYDWTTIVWESQKIAKFLKKIVNKGDIKNNVLIAAQNGIDLLRYCNVDKSTIFLAKGMLMHYDTIDYLDNNWQSYHYDFVTNQFMFDLMLENGAPVYKMLRTKWCNENKSAMIQLANMNTDVSFNLFRYGDIEWDLNYMKQNLLSPGIGNIGNLIKFTEKPIEYDGNLLVESYKISTYSFMLAFMINPNKKMLDLIIKHNLPIDVNCYYYIFRNVEPKMYTDYVEMGIKISINEFINFYNLYCFPDVLKFAIANDLPVKKALYDNLSFNQLVKLHETGKISREDMFAQSIIKRNYRGVYKYFISREMGLQIAIEYDVETLQEYFKKN